MPAPPAFARQVRHALAHLYDPDVLRTHPLIATLGLGGRANAHTSLRETLTEAIEALRPAAAVPVSSRTWRVHQVLVCRYIQQMDQEQTAHQLGVGVRHLRREQRVAVQALADALYARYPGAGQAAAAEAAEVAGRLEDELSWLKAPAQGEPAALGEALQGALELVAPLAAARGTCLAPDPLPSLPPVAVHPAGLRQAIVSITTGAIRRVPGGRVRFSAEQHARQVVLRIAAVAHGPLAPGSQDEAASLQAARAILGMYGGRIDLAEAATTLSLTLTVPVGGAVNVLLMDDNVDVAQLFERYVSGTRYRVRCIASAERLFELLAEQTPQVIILDVMMPGVDGWEILGRLRQHPLTGQLPVVVCTILPERDLALALGATAFLPKPVTRQALLAALRQALAEGPLEPR